MHYEVVGNELFLSEGGELRALSPREVWINERNPSSDCPHLSDCGLWFNQDIASLFVKLEESDSGQCGVLNLYAKDLDGSLIRLSPSHASNHALFGDAFASFSEGELSEIKKLLSSNNLSFGRDLSLADYLCVLKNFEDEKWLIVEWRFEARNWASLSMDKFSPCEPKCFTANLSDYQIEGSNWLTMMIEQGVGAILGDGMGLGKTVQMIKAICDLLDQNPAARSLVVCPSALVENWRREIRKFSRGIDVGCHVGPDRTADYRDIVCPIVLTTYDVVRNDWPVLSQIRWDLLILDEAQYIKNPHSQRTQAVKKLNRGVGIAITGTPFENHMTDIWSLMDFCCPDFLGNLSSFVAFYQDEEYSASDLGERIAPFLLRRKLEDIPNDLPELIQIPMPMRLWGDEAFEYESRRVKYLEEGATLGAINKLIGDLAAPRHSREFISGMKYEYLDAVASEVFSNNEKLIVFSNRLQSIGHIEDRYSGDIPTFILTGQTPACDRVALIDKYSEIKGSALLLCNPTVGGAGLNITAANHVFHFSPQWNPAVIDQADARAHRRGQDKPVIAHYPYYVSTIEEYMWNKVLFKRELSSRVVVGNKGIALDNEIREALEMSPLSDI